MEAAVEGRQRQMITTEKRKGQIKEDRPKLSFDSCQSFDSCYSHALEIKRNSQTSPRLNPKSFIRSYLLFPLFRGRQLLLTCQNHALGILRNPQTSPRLNHKSFIRSYLHFPFFRG